MTRYFVGETENNKREVIFALVDRSNSDLRVSGHAFALGDIKLKTPGVSIANVAVNRITEIGTSGHYSFFFTDAELELAGTGFVEIDESLTAAIPNSTLFDIEDPADYGGASGGGGGSSTLLPAGLVALDSLEETVRERGDYISSLTFTPEYIRKEIQAAFNELYEIMDDTNEGWWDTDGEVTTVASQSYIALPSNCWRVKAIDILEGSEWHELAQLGPGQRNRSRTTGRPRGYRLTSRGIELSPVPAAAYTLRVTYSPICPALDEDDGIELYGWQEFVIEGALLRLDKRSEKSIAERWKTLYDPADGLKARIISAANKRRRQGPDYLPMHGGGGIGVGATYEDPFD